MGKSDNYVFPWYASTLTRYGLLSSKKIAFLGQSAHNRFSDCFSTTQKDFFDLTLGNWIINDTEWKISQHQYDLVVCTRCAYFSSDPQAFITRVLKLCNVGGHAFIDWGLGDHWRKPTYKVGWVKGDEHEEVHYGSHISKLYSCFWIDSLEHDSNVHVFKSYIHNLRHYDMSTTTLTHIIHDEVPCVLSDDEHKPISVDTLTLWQDSPQLYISTLYKR